MPWTVGTDCAASNDSNNLLRDLRSVWSHNARNQTFETTHQDFLQGKIDTAKYIQIKNKIENQSKNKSRDHGDKNVSAYKLFKKVTSDFGSGIDDFLCGKITPGSKANLAFWDLNHPTLWPGKNPLSDLIMADGAASLCRLLLRGQWIGGQDGPKSLRYSAHYLTSAACANDRLKKLIRMI